MRGALVAVMRSGAPLSDTATMIDDASGWRRVAEKAPAFIKQFRLTGEAMMPTTSAVFNPAARPLESVASRAIVGHSAAWRDVLKQATQVASTEATTCLQGESGTGKEVVARFIHESSRRHRGPFVAINCAALPDQLLESELFGFERGAFTGAHQTKPGQIEMAAGGVLFLDEVSEMTPAAQAKVLRVLQEREFRRLGGLRAIRADVRVIAATNRDLHEALARGQLRLDLYYRLNVFDIRIPPLRERREDIVILAQAFLEERARSTGGPRVDLTAAATDTLLRHEWLGNVRELHNALERATIVCEDGLICEQDLSFTPRMVPVMVDSTNLNVVERQAIERAMRNVNGNKAMAARQLGISRTQLYGRLRKHRLESAAM
jgi:transcriptional regulator with PAS, ATPase and Fis domain